VDPNDDGVRWGPSPKRQQTRAYPEPHVVMLGDMTIGTARDICDRMARQTGVGLFMMTIHGESGEKAQQHSASDL
jgi:hypothetical protein